MNRVSIGSDNGLTPIRCQAIIQTHTGVLSIGHLGTNFNKNLINIQKLFIHENASENICEMASFLSRGRWVNSLWPSDAMWRYRCGSTLAQVIACCLTAPSHYLNQCWLTISEVLWHNLSAISHEMLKTSTLDVSLKITNLRLHLHLPGTNELIKPK